MRTSCIPLRVTWYCRETPPITTCTGTCFTPACARQVQHCTTVNSRCFPWMIRHAAWLPSRYLVHSDGLASYQRRWGRNFESGLCEFAEAVQFRDTGKQTAKLTPVWELGLRLGRDTLANEVLVGTPTGAKLARSIRRLVPSEKCSQTLFGTARGTPWSLCGDGQFPPLTVTQPLA